MIATARTLIIFDLDGTLAETAEDILDAINHVTASFSLAPLTMEKHRALVSFGGRRMIQEAFCSSGRNLADKDLEKIFRDFLSHYQANVARHSKLFPGARQALIELQQANALLAICTNKSTGPCKTLLRALQIENMFSAIVANDTFAWAKPDARTIAATIALAGGNPSTSIMIGDSSTDVKAARAADIPVIAVDFGYSDVPVAELKPDRIVSNFDALPAAIWDLIDMR